jgi:hypothetical protein
MAFQYHPFGSKPSAGGCRLSCPLLVSACDDLEQHGGVAQLNARLEQSDRWRGRLRATNLAHAALRQSLVSSAEAQAAQAELGQRFASRLLESGVAGMTIGLDDDVKCLHAQLADWLCRVHGRADDDVLNPPASRVLGRAVAAAAARRLRVESSERDADQQLLAEREEATASLAGLRGEGRRCWTACAPDHVPRPHDFAYQPRKNQIKLMHRKRRRNESKGLGQSGHTVNTATVPAV